MADNKSDALDPGIYMILSPAEYFKVVTAFLSNKFIGLL